MKNIKLILSVLYGINLIALIGAQKIDNIDCSNEELVTSIFNDPIDLTLRGVIKTYENVKINEILSTTNNEFDLNYIDARLEFSEGNVTQNLVLFTTEHFEHYAKEQTAARISLKINLGCGMGKERVVIFFQPLKEGNYFNPIFSQTTYELIIPTPIFAGFDLTAFLEITAKDDDLTHNRIEFTSDDSWQHYISVGTKNITSSDKKTYFANLTLEKILMELPLPIEFEIIATDNGNPPKSSLASVTIRSDPLRSLPVKPKFVRTLYKGLINLDFSMEPIRLQLTEGTYSSDIKFSLSVMNLQAFNLVDYKNGSLDITWNSSILNRSEILNRNSWELQVKAEHKNLAEIEKANVLVELADLKNNFHFMSSYYEGSIDELGELNITSIIFNPYTYQKDIQFSLQTSHDFFYLSIKNFTLQLQLNENFTWQVIDDSFLKLTVKASWESLNALTNIVIKLPQIKEDLPQQMFEFLKPLYIGHLNETTYDLKLEIIKLQTDVKNIDEIEYKLMGNGSDNFYMVKNNTDLEIRSIFQLINPKEMKLNETYLLVLEAKYKDLKSYTTVVINTPHAEKALKTKLFLRSLIKGKILYENSTQNLAIESVHIAKEFVNILRDFKFRLRGDYSLHFDVKQNQLNHTLDIMLKTPLSPNVLETRHFLNLSLQALAVGPKGFNDTSMVFIEMPIKECPKPLQPLPDPPKFSSSNYIFTVFTNQTGILGVINAYTKGKNVPLNYVLQIENDLLAQRLSINPFTGELSLYGFIEEGNYLFNITAENTDTRERAVARALLKVQQKEECKYFEGSTVEKTVMIRHIEEEKPFHGLLDLKFNENCTFHIVDMWPSDKEYVRVNYIFNMLDTIAIDREDEIFHNMSEPQIMVKLRLKCEKEYELRNLTIDIPNLEEKRSTLLTLAEDIPYSPNIMWLYIKIDDINDNPPEFKLYETPIYLGYPTGNAVLDIYPEYLTKVEAYDKDLGVNAEIKYSMRENLYFDIEAKTGKIYPKGGNVLQEGQQTELIVLAIDQNGEGLMTGTVVLVKALTPDHYSLVTLRGNTTKSKQELERDLRHETGFNIKILKMSYVPQVVQQRSAENQSLSCKAWIYGYHRHQLVTYKELQEQILVKHPSNNIVNMESYQEAALNSFSENNSNIGYLIATILLTLLSSSALIFIIWRFCYYKSKPLNNTKINTKSSAANNHDNHDGENGQHQLEICAECSHGSDNHKDCIECKSNSNQNENNQVKFSDLVENVIVEES